MPLPVEIPISKYFNNDRQKEIQGYTYERLDALIRGLRTIRQDKIQAWRKIYAGTPREKTKSFPWQNASNIVPQIVGSFVDQLTAKIAMGVFGVEPIWVVEVPGEYPRKFRAEEQREAIERWQTYRAYEPTKLNLVEKYVIWIRTFVKYGLGAMKLMPELVVEQVARNVSSSGRSVEFRDHIRHDGPVAHPLLFEDVLIPPTIAPLERTFMAQHATLFRWDLESLKFDESYDRAALNTVLKSPDRNGPDPNKRDLEMETGAMSDPSTISDEWDIYECHFPYNVAGKLFHLIVTYHHTTRTTLKAVFNWLPDNAVPYILSRLGSDGERAYGYGFCEMLKDYQEEIAAIHNQRSDARTLANTNILRVAPGLQVDSNFSIYPNSLFPGEKDSLEVIPLGRTAAESIKDEQIVLQEATDRAGIGPSSSGQGAGTVNKKGSYSAMGTFAVMQEGNTRANLNVTEFKTSHYTFGRLALLYDSHFGVTEGDIKALGKQGLYMKTALESVRDGKIILPIRAATGSVNKEIEKQNSMLLLNNVRMYQQQMAQILQAVENPMVPPMLRAYYWQQIESGTFLMRKIARDFGMQDSSTIVPDITGVREKAEKSQVAVAQQIQQEEQQSQTALPQPQSPGAPNALPPGENTLQ